MSRLSPVVGAFIHVNAPTFFSPAKQATVYVKAAKLIAEGKSFRACWAINKAQGFASGAWNTSRQDYEEFMLNNNPWSCLLYPAGKQFPRGPEDPAAHDCRVLALLLMAEVVRDGAHL